MQALIVGCGYLGRRVAARWKAAGHEVSVLTRSPERAEAFRAEGYRPVVGDVIDPESLTLPNVDVLLYAVGFDRTAAADKRTVYVDGVSHVLSGRFGVRRVIYISSSSVYGASDGRWVDEEAEESPVTESGRICLDAEAVVVREAERQGFEHCILRLTGIYGPGRLLARASQLQAGDPLAGEPDAWLNLVHVDDAARAVEVISESELGRSLYLLSDDRPVRRREYYSRLAELVGAPEPTFSPETAARHGRGLNKRCSNRRVVSDLALTLTYPDFEAGLPASLEASES